MRERVGVLKPTSSHRRTSPLKNTREQLDILNAYRETGSYRAAARLCHTTDKTVKRVVRGWRQADRGSGGRGAWS